MEKYEWYVLHVRTDSELDIAKALESRGFSTAVPIENRIIRKSGKWIKKAYIVLQVMFLCLCDTAGQNTTL